MGSQWPPVQKSPGRKSPVVKLHALKTLVGKLPVGESRVVRSPLGRSPVVKSPVRAGVDGFRAGSHVTVKDAQQEGGVPREQVVDRRKADVVPSELHVGRCAGPLVLDVQCQLAESTARCQVYSELTLPCLTHYAQEMLGYSKLMMLLF